MLVVIAWHIKDLNEAMWFVAPRGQQRNKNRCGSTQSQISLVVKDDVLSDEEKTKAGRSLQRVIQNGG